MEFTYTEFKKFKSRILNIEIVAGEAHNFDVSDQFDPPNPEGSILASAIWPHFKNGKSIFASSAGWLFASINIEINENLLLPVNDKQKLTYLEEMKRFCMSIENKIN